MKNITLFILSFIIFSFLILFFKSYYFFGEKKYNEYIENNYIEVSALKSVKIEKQNTDDIIIENTKIIKNYENNKEFIYIPENFYLEIFNYTNIFNATLSSDFFKNKIKNLKIELYKEKNDVRGRMKNKSIKLYGVKDIEISEFLSVGIHELGHYIDLYFLKQKIYTDLSDYFYNISWESTKIMKVGLNENDFVSGYSMTNKYEDFSESFTYFILHNNDFLEKTKKSEILKNKYNYFSKYLFRNKEFINTDFSINNKVENYYWDITKINFSLEKFLQFLKY